MNNGIFDRLTAGFHAAEAALAKEMEGRQQAEALGRPPATPSEADAQDAQALRSAVAAALAPALAARKRAHSSVPSESASHAHSTGPDAAGGGSGGIACGSGTSGDLVLLAEPIRCINQIIDFDPACMAACQLKGYALPNSHPHKLPHGYAGNTVLVRL